MAVRERGIEAIRELENAENDFTFGWFCRRRSCIRFCGCADAGSWRSGRGSTNERRLYYFTGSGEAIRYPVGVGRAGMQWSGTAFIDGKYIQPAWTPPASIRGDYRRLPPVVPGGSSRNPMGVAAMTLSGGGEYAIHGTNAPGTIGGFVSHGCIRMYNEDIMELYNRVSIGTRVVVTR